MAVANLIADLKSKVSTILSPPLPHYRRPSYLAVPPQLRRLTGRRRLQAPNLLTHSPGI